MPEPAVRRVLMSGDAVGGVWTYTMELAAGLGVHGIQVVLASMGAEPSAGQLAEAAAIPNLRLMTSRYKLEWMSDPWADVAASGQWLMGLARLFRPDVIHLNSFGHGALPWQTPVLLTAHSCVLSWWAAVKGGSTPSEWDRYRDTVQRTLQSVDAITAPTAAMLRAIEYHYGSELPESRVVPNGCGGARFCPSMKEPFILTAGRLWDDAKNIAAVARVAPNLPWPTYVAGEHRHPDGSAVTLPGCHMLGRLAPRMLADWYGRAAIYALPARYEPFGLSILEAALSGCALVVGDIDSLREVWDDDAIFVSPHNDAELQAALGKLIANPALRAEMARRGMARAQMFTTARMAAEYAEAYDSILQERRLACAS